MYETNYQKASDVNDAASKMKKADDAKYLAGGMTLIPTMKARLASPSDVIDVAGIGSLKKISSDGATLSIGAGVTHAEVAASEEVIGAIPALAGLAAHIGDPAVRHRGTIGGSLANNDPAADYPAAALGLGATIVTNSREIAADDFFSGLFETALNDGELITEVRFPIPQKAGYEKFPNPASRYALVGVFVSKSDAGARVAVTGAGEGGVFRHGGAESALGADFSADALGSISTDAGDLLSDIHAGAEYRAHLVGVVARRAVANAG